MPDPRSSRFRLRFLLRAVCCTALAVAALRGQPDSRRRFDVPADTAPRSLKLFSDQSGRTFVAEGALLREVRTNAVTGEFTPAQALAQMLAGTPLTASEDARTGAFAITRARNDPAPLVPRPAERGDAPPATARRQSGAGDGEAVVQLGAFAVTGTSIKRIETERALPVTLIEREAIDTRDAQSPIELLSGLPQVVSVPLSEAATAGATARGDNSSISLRGLSSGSTLVLLNGRRLAPHPISAAESGVPALSPNVGQLPNRGVARLEVLRDGASSLYGSDAVAGVVNFITEKDFRGAELTTRYGGAPRGAGDEWRTTLQVGRGFSGDRGRLSAVVDVYHRTGIFLRDRTFSADADLTARAPAPWNDVNADPDFFLRTTASSFGNFAVGTVAANGTFGGTRPAGVPAALVSSAGNFFLVPNGAGGVAFKTTTPLRTGGERDYYYNINDEQVVQPRSTRYNILLSGELDLTSGLTAFGDATYYRARSSTWRDSDVYSSTIDAPMIVPATNPWNPFGTRFFSPTGAPNADGTPRLTGTPSPVRVLSKRFVEFGSRQADVDSQVYRALAGLRGDLFGSWKWEGAVLYTAARTLDDETPATRESLILRAVNQTEPGRAFNPFGYNFAVQGGTIAVTTPFRNPASVVSTFQETFTRKGTSSIASADLRATGELFRLWGGNAASASFGGEWRRETYTDFRPPFDGLNPPGSGLDPTDNDIMSLAPNSDTDARRTLVAGFGELVFPVVGNRLRLPLVQSLELNASYRVERYSDFGRSSKPKIGASWRVNPRLLFRASHNEGFRAPNLAQLFTGELLRNISSVDTYRSPVTALPIDGNTIRLERRSGNARLRPEESRGKSIGVVLDLPRVKGLSVSADYWEINQLGLIDNTTAIPDDLDLLLGATAAALAAGQNINAIDLGSGSAAYKGSPDVVRLPVTPGDRDLFAAYNATRAPGDQRAPVGQIQYTRQTYVNKSRQFVNGFDYSLAWRFPATRFGRFLAQTEWSRINAFFNYPTPGAPRDNRFWEAGAAKWRGNATLTWRRGGWGAGLGAYYIGSYQDAGASVTEATYNSLGRPAYISRVFDTGALRFRYIVRDTLTWNTHVSWSHRGVKGAWLADSTVRLGVVNVFDTEPPLSQASRGYDPAVYTTLARGRTWSVQVSKKL